MIIAFTGAGISKESGIDTFQDRPNIREKLTRDFANRHPEEYVETMRKFVETMVGKEPNDAHIALAEFDIPVITMNVDRLHELAGTKNLLKLHGRLPSEAELPICNTLYNTPVLYGDPAPAYKEAYDMIECLREDDIFLVIGASDYTMVSALLRTNASIQGAKIVEIQDSASIKVREFLVSHKEDIEDFELRKNHMLRLKKKREEGFV